MEIPTIRIKHEGFPEGILVNSEDFDPSNHQPFDAEDDSKPLEEMKAGELLAYAKEKSLDIGDLKPQHGAEKVLSAIREAEA
jgi:hypothetical protein